MRADRKIRKAMEALDDGDFPLFQQHVQEGTPRNRSGMRRVMGALAADYAQTHGGFPLPDLNTQGDTQNGIN